MARFRRNSARKLTVETLEDRSVFSGVSLWQNPSATLDVNHDGALSPIDALLVIDPLNASQGGALSALAPPILSDDLVQSISNFVDTNGDGALSPIDVLLVIDAINNGTELEGLPPLPDDDQQSDSIGSAAQTLDLSTGHASSYAKINDAIDRDAYKVTTALPRLAVGLFATDGATLAVRLVDESGAELVVAETSSTPLGELAFFDALVDVGSTYYLVVSGVSGITSSTGSYVLQVYNYDPAEYELVPDSPLGTDIHGDTIATATNLDVSNGLATVVSNIDTATDVDVFRVNAVAGLLTVSASTGMTVSVLDSAGTLIDTSTISDALPLIIEVVEATYYVRMESTAGDTQQYSMIVFNTPTFALPAADSQLGDDPHGSLRDSTATALTFNEQRSILASYVDEDGDHDVFRFVAGTGTTTIEAFASTILTGSDDFSPFFRVYDASGVEVTPTIGNVVIETGFMIAQFELTQGATYYIDLAADDSKGTTTGLYYLGVGLEGKLPFDTL